MKTPTMEPSVGGSRRGTRPGFVGLLVVTIAALAACGSDSPTPEEYAETAGEAVMTMNLEIDAVSERFEAASTSEEVLALWDQRIAARESFIVILEELPPPDNLVEVHVAAVDIVTRLIAAERAMGTRAETFTSVEEFSSIWDTAEGQAALAVDAEAVAICRAAETGLSESSGSEFAVAGWLEPQVGEVIDVVFGCTAEDRLTGP